jgi:APA family basic amino acid/polyamine antiporter
MTGVSLFSLPDSLRAFGAYSWLGWTICTIAMLVLALIFGKLAQAMPGIGPYGYAYRLFANKRIALIVGLMHLSAIVVQLGAIVYTLHQHLIGSCESHWLIPLICSYLPIIVSTISNSYNISTTNRIIIAIGVIKYIPLFVFIAYGLTTIDTHACWTFDSHDGISSTIGSIALIIYAFSGLEFGVVFNPDRVHNPTHTIPHALWIGTLCAALIFTAVQAIVWTHVPLQSAMPVPDAAHAMFGPIGHHAFSVLAIIFLYGALNTSVLITADLIQIMAQHDQLPKHQPRLSFWIAGGLTCFVTFLLFQGLVGYNTPFYKAVLKLSDFLLACVFFATVLTYQRLPNANGMQMLVGLVAASLLMVVSGVALWE